MKQWFIGGMPKTNCTAVNPPVLADSLDILRARFDEKSVIYDEWMLGSSKQVHAADKFRSANVPRAVPQSTRLSSDMSTTDEVSQRLNTLMLSATTLMQNNTGARQVDFDPVVCFICGNPCGPDGVHAVQLLTFDTQQSRYVVPSGELPTVPSGWNGRLAAYL
ncbi:hypothetical protein BDP27DRAFT_1425804 [Rhodocollybia butyracea]|uniref:Uncharacterized protein n=1 Tax=Rhodocollybia butyracea TaxID=206335 RepID=A0A9P5U2C1_9AGAR|nr:hypothetical protein BDP27DRAFT_1425804 [Rhodocollybia butyracea]